MAISSPLGRPTNRSETTIQFIKKREKRKPRTKIQSPTTKRIHQHITGTAPDGDFFATAAADHQVSDYYNLVY